MPPRTRTMSTPRMQMEEPSQRRRYWPVRIGRSDRRGADGRSSPGPGAGCAHGMILETGGTANEAWFSAVLMRMRPVAVVLPGAPEVAAALGDLAAVPGVLEHDELAPGYRSQANWYRSLWCRHSPLVDRHHRSGDRRRRLGRSGSWLTSKGELSHHRRPDRKCPRDPDPPQTLAVSGAWYRVTTVRSLVRRVLKLHQPIRRVQRSRAVSVGRL